MEVFLDNTEEISYLIILRIKYIGHQFEIQLLPYS